MIFAALFLFPCNAAPAAVSQGEKITYSISPSGKAEYEDMGIVDYRGRNYWLVTFRTSLVGFNDLEKIYADPDTGMPVIVERRISWPLSKEFIVEEYDQGSNSLTVRKFRDDKLSEEHKYTSNGPYHNAILLPFYLRRIGEMKAGWSMAVRLQEPFTVTLVGIEDVNVNDKKITAYHFKSKPDKFEIWVSKDNDRLPVLIKGTVGCSMTLRDRSISE